jgi:hypothetical protein
VQVTVDGRGKIAKQARKSPADLDVCPESAGLLRPSGRQDLNLRPRARSMVHKGVSPARTENPDVKPVPFQALQRSTGHMRHIHSSHLAPLPPAPPSRRLSHHSDRRPAARRLTRTTSVLPCGHSARCEAKAFQRVLDAFTEKTGIKARFRPATRTLDQELRKDLQTGTQRHVAILASWRPSPPRARCNPSTSQRDSTARCGRPSTTQSAPEPAREPDRGHPCQRRNPLVHGRGIHAGVGLARH